MTARDVLRNAARRGAHWVDLQYSLTIQGLHDVAPLARGELLDVGCGEKPYESIFRPFVTRYVGIEHEGSYTQTDASARGTGPDHYYDGTRLPFDDASFDTVLSVQVLEHTPSPQALLNEMARVLRPGGTLLLSAPFSFRLHEEPHDYFRYTPHGLRDMCARAELDVVRIDAQGGLWSLLAHKLNSFLAFRVAIVGGAMQAMGKLGHEARETRRPRYWTVPLVGPMVVGMSASARVLDRMLPDPSEALSFLLVARRPEA